jgi:hypothetical protein
MSANENVNGREGKSSQPGVNPSPSKRYEVQFQKDCLPHSDTNDPEQAKYYARSLANWNHAAQVYDRVTQSIIFRTQAYSAKRRCSNLSRVKS